MCRNIECEGVNMTINFATMAKIAKKIPKLTVSQIFTIIKDGKMLFVMFKKQTVDLQVESKLLMNMANYMEHIKG